jgi:uncharacterized DUF497 family protein
MVLFDWDDENRAHIAAHKVSCAEAEQVINNEPFDLELQAVNGEERFLQFRGNACWPYSTRRVHVPQKLGPRDYSI